MKKNYFLLMCSLFLSVALVATSCSDEDTPAPEPSFPEKTTQTVVAGETIELSFIANYDWTATISEETYTYFQLLNGETKTNTLTGKAGEQTIRVAVADVPVYEDAPVATVTLEMNGQKQVIAELQYPLSQRQLTFYAPVESPYGGYKGGAYGGEYAYAYEEAAMASGTMLKMEYGVERGNAEEAPENTFFVPVKIEADFEYTLVGPEWMMAAAAGEIGTQEHIIKADNTLIPAATEFCTIEVLVAGTETVVGSFDVKITGYEEYFELTTTYMEYTYDYQGNAAGLEFTAYYTAGRTTGLWVYYPAGDTTHWIAAAPLAAGSDSMIVDIETTFEVQPNEGATREAYVFVMPKALTSEEAEATFIVDGEITEVGNQYALGKIIQHGQPATIEAQVDDTCASFSEIGPDFANSWIFDEYVFRGKYLGNKYDVFYWGEWAKYAHEMTSFTASRPIASLTAYSYTASGSMAEASWVEARTYGADGTQFKIYCEDPAAIPAEAQNWQTGDYEAVILVEYTDGSYSAIYFHFNENAGGSSSGEGGVAFVQPEYAGMMGASLEKLEAGNELYDTYFYEYSSDYAPADFYLLTYNYPIMDYSSLNMVALTGVEAYVQQYNSEWITWNADNSSITMDPAGVGEVGAVTFRDDNWVNRVVILCQILSAE